MTIEKLNSRSVVPRANRNEHASCLSYYSSEEAEFAWERERHVAEQFGYTGCCMGLVDPRPI